MAELLGVLEASQVMVQVVTVAAMVAATVAATVVAAMEVVATVVEKGTGSSRDPDKRQSYRAYCRQSRRASSRTCLRRRVHATIRTEKACRTASC